VKIRMLGTGGAVPSLRRLSSAYFLSLSRGNMLIDVGPSVVRRLLEFGRFVNDVDIIVLTHFHPDHAVDLSTFLFTCNFGGEERQRPLFLCGGRGVKRFYNLSLRLYPSIAPKSYDLTVRTLARGRCTVGGVSLFTTPMVHREESIAVRVEEGGKSVVFSGDTDESPALAQLAADADLLVVECSFPDRKMQGHLDLQTLLPLVAEAKPKQVVLTHLDPEWELYRAPLPAPLILGEDGMEIEI